MNKNGTIALVIVVILIIVGAVMYASAPKVPTMTDTQTQSGGMVDDVMVVTTSTTTSTTTLSEVSSFTVTGKNFSFSPSSITVKKGDRVRVTLQSVDGVHDFRIDQFGVATPQVGDGKSTVVEFTANVAGSFEYYCSIGNHRAMGMKGTLIVKE